MQVDVVLGLFELRVSIELRLRLAPIKTVAPIGDELAHVVDAGPVSPGLARRGVGEPGTREAVAQIGDVGVGDMKDEGICGHVVSRRNYARQNGFLASQSA